MKLTPQSRKLALALAAHVLVVVVGVLPLWSAHLFGWIAADEGYLNSAAARFAEGQVPHRDFVDRFPGALVAWNAAARRVFGETFAGPRRGLLVAAVVLLVLLHDLARRVLPALPAALVALAASTWGVPKWFAANPTWFVLLFALAAIRLLLEGFERRGGGWFVAAGVCAALATSFKQTAGAFATAALCAAIAVEACERFRSTAGRATGTDRAMAILGALALPAVLGFVLVRQGGLYYPVLLVLAPAIVAAGVGVAAARGRLAAGTARRTLLIALGFAIGGAPLFIYYALHGGLAAAGRGIFLEQWGALGHFLPYTGLALGPPLLKALLWGGAGAIAAATPRGIARWAPALPPLHSALAAAAVAGGSLAGFLELWCRDLVMFLPLGVSATAAVAIARGVSLGGAGALALLTSAIFGVVYPLGAFLYGWYVAPLAILAAAMLARRAYGAALVGVAAGLGVAAALAFPPGADQTDGGPAADRSAIVLGGAGGGLRLPPAEGSAIETLAAEVRARTEPGEPIFTYPADFGLYALADRPNPTRHMWVDFYADCEDFEEILEILDRIPVRVVVVRTVMPIRNPCRPMFLDGLNARYAPAVHHPPYLLTTRRADAGEIDATAVD